MLGNYTLSNQVLYTADFKTYGNNNELYGPDYYSTNFHTGKEIPNSVTTYNTPAAAISAFQSSYYDEFGVSSSFPLFLKHNVVSDIITENYIGFVITPELASLDSELTAGTYYFNGGPYGRLFVDNAKALYDAFGSYCSSNPYSDEINDYFDCSFYVYDDDSGESVEAYVSIADNDEEWSISDIYIYSYSDGVGTYVGCYIDEQGNFYCYKQYH